MISQNVTVMNETGIHARPASIFVKTASQFKSNITVYKDNKSGSAKSIISILGLGITKGTEIKITADGEDEKEALAALVQLIESKFDEE